MGVIVISPNNSFTRIIEETLSEIVHPLVCHSGFRNARLHLTSGFFRWCIVDAEQGLQHAVESLQRLGDKAKNCRWIAVAESPTSLEIEHACRRGFYCVIPKPLQPNLLRPLLLPQKALSPALPNRAQPIEKKAALPTGPNLEEARNFSRIFSQSKDLSEVVQQFILRVRELAGVNRIAIFLESPTTTNSSRQNRLQHFSSIGIPVEIRDILELSRSSGIGGWVTRSGQILQAEVATETLSPEELLRAQREFKILGCEIAIPITDRERTIGVAILGGHLTRSTFSDEELQLLFHLMEELGLSIKNIRLHQELATSYRLLRDVLASMKTGSLVVSADLEIPYANPAITDFLLGGKAEKSALVFADLPPIIAEKVHALTERGIQADPFIFKNKNHPDTYRVTVIPFPDEAKHLPQSAMLLMEKLADIDRKTISTEPTNLSSGSPRLPER